MIFFHLDPDLLWVFGFMLTLLLIASVVALVLRGLARSESAQRTMANVMARIGTWWVLCAIFAFAWRWAAERWSCSSRCCRCSRCASSSL